MSVKSQIDNIIIFSQSEDVLICSIQRIPTYSQKGRRQAIASLLQSSHQRSYQGNQQVEARHRRPLQKGGSLAF